MRAEALVPSAELLAAACSPSCLLAAATLMVDASGNSCGDVEEANPIALAAELFASPCLDVSAVGFAVALLSLIAVDTDGMDLVQGLAPWLWSLLPLLRSLPADDEEEDQMDCGDQQTSQQEKGAREEMDTTPASSSGSNIGKRKGKQPQKTAGKEKAGKKSQKASNTNMEDATLSRPRGVRRVQFCFVDGSSVQPPVSDDNAVLYTLLHVYNPPYDLSSTLPGQGLFLWSCIANSSSAHVTR